MLRPYLTVVALLFASTSSYASNNCDSIRIQIDSRVRASGVTDFVLSVVDAGAKINGKVVGSCDLGTKKIVYNQRPLEERILTECKDGTVTVGGDCKK